MFGDWGDEEAAGGWDKHILPYRCVMSSKRRVGNLDALEVNMHVSREARF